MSKQQALFPGPIPTLTQAEIEVIAEGPERTWRASDFADDGTPVTVELRFRHTKDGGLVILGFKSTPRKEN